jgi:hypothetical protein
MAHCARAVLNHGVELLSQPVADGLMPVGVVADPFWQIAARTEPT